MKYLQLKRRQFTEAQLPYISSETLSSSAVPTFAVAAVD